MQKEGMRSVVNYANDNASDAGRGCRPRQWDRASGPVGTGNARCGGKECPERVTRANKQTTGRHSQRQGMTGGTVHSGQRGDQYGTGLLKWQLKG